LYKPKEVELDAERQTIVVDNGTYQSTHIKVHANEATTLQFVRKDAPPCAETLLFPDLDISETLPLNKVKRIELPALQTGTYRFHCQMQMYRGELHVE
jgi:plastocyanin domain-containing protein